MEELSKKNYISGKLKFSTNISDSVSKSDIVFICVGTPTKRNSNAADLTQIFKLAKEISKYVKKFKIIITKSTVPVTTGDKIEKIISKKVSKKLFAIVSNPEFLREGEAIRDFNYPDRVVIGTDNLRANKILKTLYSPLISKGAIYFHTSSRAAELIKYSSNSFLATKITFINEISNLCEKINVNVEDIAIGMGLDKRIGSRFLRAGPAYGGSCFPKDTRAITSTADKFNTNLSLIKSVIKSNENRSAVLLKRVSKILKNKFKNKLICFLGVTFKSNTDDMRESSSLKMIPFLSKKGAKIRYFDPSGRKKEFNKIKNVNYSKSIKEACLKLTKVGAKRALILPVGGAFHSPLMEDAKEKLSIAINNSCFNQPICPIYQNVNGIGEKSLEKIKENLISQLTSPVKWTQSVNQMIKDGTTEFIEIGPGKVLQGLVNKIDRNLATSFPDL